MKRLLISGVSLALLAASTAASAGGGYYGGHRGYYRGYNDGGWYFLGGLLLGGLLTSAYQHSRQQYYPPRGYAAPAVHKTYYHSYPVERHAYRRPPVSDRRVATGRRLHRDLQGRCFEIRYNDAGDELRIELPAAECSW